MLIKVTLGAPTQGSTLLARGINHFNGWFNGLNQPLKMWNFWRKLEGGIEQKRKWTHGSGQQWGDYRAGGGLGEYKDNKW